MQPAIRESCAVDIELNPQKDEPLTPIVTWTIRARGWIDDALDWLDRYWDDPELRSGFWRSGW